jgi:hypothetical protein
MNALPLYCAYGCASIKNASETAAVQLLREMMLCSAPALLLLCLSCS